MKKQQLEVREDEQEQEQEEKGVYQRACEVERADGVLFNVLLNLSISEPKVKQ